MPVLHVVTCSTRPGRVGPTVAAWFVERARAHGGFAIEEVDLAEPALPLFDEPRHPRLRQYEHEHTRAWSARVARADALVLVTPEYNYSSPPALVNALDYLLREWAYLPVGLVSYGGVSGGLRAAQMTKLLVTALRMMPVPDGVGVAGVAKKIVDGRLDAGEDAARSAATMLDELARWTGALAGLRAGVRLELGA
jgi:NAD(P)H-dependent FMN reductase